MWTIPINNSQKTSPKNTIVMVRAFPLTTRIVGRSPLCADPSDASSLLVSCGPRFLVVPWPGSQSGRAVNPVVEGSWCHYDWQQRQSENAISYPPPGNPTHAVRSSASKHDGVTYPIH